MAGAKAMAGGWVLVGVGVEVGVEFIYIYIQCWQNSLRRRMSDISTLST